MEGSRAGGPRCRSPKPPDSMGPRATSSPPLLRGSAWVSRRSALAALAALVAACTRAGGRGAPRVVSISPSMTEAVFAIGAGDVLVGRSRFCDYPPEATRLPVVGGFADPSLEAIVALRPTLVVSARGPAGAALAQALEAHGIAVYSPETESIAQIDAALTELGRRLSHDDGAREAVAAIEAARSRVAAAVSGRPPVRAAFLFDVAPIFAAGPGSFADQLVREAGGTNVVTAGGAYPTLDIERLLALDPEVILDGSGDERGASRVAEKRDEPGWSKLRAVREGKVRALAASVVLRPGPRIGRGLEAVARALHGEALPTPPESAP
jgi:iron complex transport system substrate-binding protein